ncbi:MAG TPA: hypothetical protein VL131_04345, partial [Gammaproteobacteria bacterium]|nr:hypothetical protein [Gammaproteobacteria bacterium]
MQAIANGTSVWTKLRSVPRSVAMATVAALALVAAANGNAQDRSRSSATLDKPDFSGVWEGAARGTPNPRTAGVSPSAQGGAGSQGAPPLKPEFVAAYQAELKRLA